MIIPILRICARIFLQAILRHKKLVQHTRTNFCLKLQVHEIDVKKTRNPKSKKNLCASSENSVRPQNREKIIENSSKFGLNFDWRLLRPQKELRAQILAPNSYMMKFLKKHKILRGFFRILVFSLFYHLDER